MKQLVTRKMARVLAECCCYHEMWAGRFNALNPSYGYNGEARMHQKFVDVIQELMARRMVIQGKGKGI